MPLFRVSLFERARHQSMQHIPLLSITCRSRFLSQDVCLQQRQGKPDAMTRFRLAHSAISAYLHKQNEVAHMNG